MAQRLTDSHARNVKPKARPYKLTDGNGLHLLVRPNGSRLWRYRYRIGGVENLYAIGDYPQMSLQQARDARDAARALVKQGIHPSRQRKADRLVVNEAAANTFEVIGREWIDLHRSHWSPGYLGQVEITLSRDVFPAIGGLPIRVITAAQILAIINHVAKRGAPNVAILILQWCGKIFRRAVSTLRADSDPTYALRGAVKKPKVQHKRALSATELGELLNQIKPSEGTPEVRIALQLLLLTFVRPGELRKALWSEFDLEKAEWRIPAERMKMRKPHLVPLSRQAIELLQQLRQEGVGGPYLFPNFRDRKRPMSPTTLNRKLNYLGYAGKFSAHGFRATASTLLNEKGYRPDVIERQLAHAERNKVRASYNHATYLDERREMMQDWADFLDEQRVESQSC